VQKNTVKLSVFFALLGSERLTAAHNMLVKLTPGGVAGATEWKDGKFPTYLQEYVSFILTSRKIP